MRLSEGITNSKHEFEQALGLAMDREAWVLQSMGSQRVGHDRVTELN